MNEYRGRAADVRRDGDIDEDRGRRRGSGLLAGAIALVAAASLGTLVLVNSPAGAPILGNLAASFVNPAPPDGGGGKGDPTTTATDTGKGQPAAGPVGKGQLVGQGKGQPTPTASGKGKGQPTPTPSGKGKGFGPQPTTTTLAAAQQAAGFRVRTLSGLPEAQLERVTVRTVTFDTAPGGPTETSVTLDYAFGQTQISVTEVTDPLPMPTAQPYANDLTVGASTYLLVPQTGPVSLASTKAPDGVSIVVTFDANTQSGSTGTDRQTAQQVLQQLS